MSIADWRLWLVVIGLLALLMACHRFIAPDGGRRGDAPAA